ncbi:MFS transporter [Catellatospora sp. TT07R-123]|uniref:MFS transporter n=1 Tax=Catellatospora sp. TT07R-123 TaxID=2733863 RepID=UPI001B06412B|nr:MFS transporter [Catellatospora sp. TT07R-123]GHJ46286.1 MFS transporter [Catellatospora sp. TT07R-123]
MTFLRQTVGGLPRVFWMLFSVMLVNRLGAFGLLLLPTYLTSARGATLAVAGLVTGVYGAGGAVGTLLGGVLADRWGRKPTYLAGLSTASVLMLAMGLARPLWLIAVLAGGIGLAHSLPGPATVAAIVDVLPEADRSRAFNLQFWAFNMGGAIAASVAGLIAEASFTALFFIDGAMTAATALAVWRLIPETLRRPAAAPAVGGSDRGFRSSDAVGAHVSTADSDHLPQRAGLGTVLRDRVFLTFVGLTFVLALLTVQGQSILQLAMEGDGLRPAAYGAVVSLGGAMIVVGQLFVPRLIRGRRHATVLAGAFALLAVGYSAVALAGPLWTYLAAASVWTIGQMLAAPPNASIIAELAPARLRGRYQGVFFLVFPAAGFVAPTVGGWSLQQLGSWHWVGCGLLGMLAAAGHLVAARTRERRTDHIRVIESAAASGAPEPAVA